MQQCHQLRTLNAETRVTILEKVRSLVFQRAIWVRKIHRKLPFYISNHADVTVIMRMPWYHLKTRSLMRQMHEKWSRLLIMAHQGAKPGAKQTKKQTNFTLNGSTFDSITKSLLSKSNKKTNGKPEKRPTNQAFVPQKSQLQIKKSIPRKITENTNGNG